MVAEQTPPPPCYLPTAVPDRDNHGPRPGSFPASPPHDDNQRAPLVSTSGSSFREEKPPSILDTARLEQATAPTRRPANTQAALRTPVCRHPSLARQRHDIISRADNQASGNSAPPNSPDKLWFEVGWFSSQFKRYLRNHTITCHYSVSIRSLGTRPLAAHPPRP